MPVPIAPRAVALIPARSGSQRLKHKNIRPLGGHPLIAYTIAAASDSGVFADVVVSTDSETYAVIARHYGADVPFLRPATISGSTSPDIEWVIHALETLASGGRCTRGFRHPSPDKSVSQAGNDTAGVADISRGRGGGFASGHREGRATPRKDVGRAQQPHAAAPPADAGGQALAQPAEGRAAASLRAKRQSGDRLDGDGAPHRIQLPAPSLCPSSPRATRASTSMRRKTGGTPSI